MKSKNYIKPVCSECGEPQKARGLCGFHYDRERRAGRLKLSTVTRTVVEARDARGQKLCIRCRGWKPESEYSSNSSRKDGLSPYCRVCVQDLWATQYRDKNYGLPPGTTQSLLESQEFKCPICYVPIDKSACVDHDHACCPGTKACGKCVRGVVCFNCNVLLGRAQDSVAVLQSAIKYLDEWNRKNDSKIAHPGY